MHNFSLVYQKLKQSKPNGDPIVAFTAGNFDLIHYGYTVTFEEAKRHCDRFIVFLHKDPSETRYTKYKPVMPLYERYKTLTSIKYIDEVYIYSSEDELLELIKFFDPDVRILGEDYIGKSFTGDNLPMEIIYTTRSHNRSTTMIKNRIAAMTVAQNPSLINRMKYDEIKQGNFSSIE